MVIVLRRDIHSFAELDARLASVRWERRHVPMPARSLMPGEPEHVCPAGLFGRGTPFSRPFPDGYDAIGSALRPGPIWLAWTYAASTGRDAIAFDGLVFIRSQWVWFPQLFRVVGERLG